MVLIEINDALYSNVYQYSSKVTSFTSVFIFVPSWYAKRPKRTWKEVVREDCQARKMNKEDAMDRCKCWKMIKDVR